MIDRIAEDTVAARLARELPRWSLEDGAIVRTFRTHSWKGTMLAVGAIGHLAEAAWHHPDLRVTYAAVEVRLTTHDAGGVSERDFALAARIEEVVGWRPQGALEGPPDGPRHGYVKAD